MNKLDLSIVLLLFTFFSINLNAQSVSADEVIRKAFSGEEVTYENTRIIGVVDLTPYKEKKEDLPTKFWWSGNTNTVSKLISGKLTFINCVFENDFLAYYHDDKTEYTFTADFKNNIVFKNCQFKEQLAFKYSNFNGLVDFSGSTVAGEANFKYAEFEESADFSSVNFMELANFKYAEYNNFVNYSSCLFNEEANFKYAQMEEGVNFNKVVFKGFLNFKYCEMDGEVILTDFQVKGDIDTKYTEVNGQDFTTFILKNN